jgi:flagellar motor protein MotB
MTLGMATRAQAESVFGGLGPVGVSISSGTEGKPGQVNPTGEHAFVVDPKTGDFFVADELTTTETKELHYARIQEFNQKGEPLAENRIRVRSDEKGTYTPVKIGGLAVDPKWEGRERVYLLLKEERAAINEKIDNKLEEAQAELAKKDKELQLAKEHSEPTAQLEKEIKALEEEEEKLEKEGLIRNPEAYAAAELYAFSTVVNKKKELEKETITSSAVLEPESEEGKVPLLFPTGIAVDPKTHDVVIVGRQNESTQKLAGEEEEAEYERTAVQRVHANGTLGPRYIDTGDCLHGEEQNSKEPFCEEDQEEFGSSPIVSSGGRVYVQDGGEEIWEIPASADAAEGFKEVAALPKHLYTVKPEGEYGVTPVLKGEAHEQEGGAMSFVPGKEDSGEGTIYLDAKIENGGAGEGVVALNYAEHEDSDAVKELGWTGGQESLSPQTKCVIRGELYHPVLVAGGSGEEVFAFSGTPESGGVKVLEFGPNGEACGQRPTVTPPSVEVGNDKNATKMTVGETATLSSKVGGAHATSVLWRFKFKNAETGKTEEEASVTTPYDLQVTTSLEHKFTHVGEYEITESVSTDNLSYPTAAEVTTKGLKVLPEFTVVIGRLEQSPVSGEALHLEAHVTGSDEQTPHLEYVWSYGDGTTQEGTTVGAENAALVRGEHTYTSTGSREVTLEVKDGLGESKKVGMKVVVGESQAEKEAAKKKQEEEQHEREQHEKEQHEKEQREKEQHEKEQQERAQHEKEQQEREQHEKEHSEVKGFYEAKLASTVITVSRSGAFTVKVTCPTGDTSCTGTVTLRTLTAVSAGTHKKKAVLTLASGAFTSAGGQSKTLMLHLVSQGRALLASSHDVLRAQATLVARDTAGATGTAKATVTLRLAKR